MNTKTVKEIAKLPKFSKRVCNSVYRLTDTIYVDNMSGLGSTKVNSEIRTKGFSNYLPLETFMRLCSAVEDRAGVDLVLKGISDGRGIACPNVFVNVDPFTQMTNGVCRVLAHDGYNTCVALQELGIDAIDFQFIMLGYGAKHIYKSQDFCGWLGKGIMAENGTTLVTNSIGRITIG